MENTLMLDGHEMKMAMTRNNARKKEKGEASERAFHEQRRADGKKVVSNKIINGM